MALALAAFPLQGQQTAPASGGPGFHGALLAGQGGMSGDVHRFLGAHAAVSWERWGGAMHALRGSGNGYGSTLLSAGPTRRFPVHPRAEFEAMLGVAFYGESLDATDRSGSVVGPSAALLVRVPAGPVNLLVGFTGWWASYTDEIAVNPVPAQGLRFVLGVGR